jgi:DNA modification methylase
LTKKNTENNFSLIPDTKKLGGSGGKEATHSAGKGLIFHDWFPYLEGFSQGFVHNLVDTYIPNAKLIIEPFAGVGTTPIALAQRGISCSYCEVNPVLQHLIKTKSRALTSAPAWPSLDDFNKAVNAELIKFKNTKPDKALAESYFQCFKESAYFDSKALEKVLKLKTIERSAPPDLKDYFAVAIYSSLLQGSLLRRAGDVRFKTEKELAKGTPDILELVQKKLLLIGEQIFDSGSNEKSKSLDFLCGDSKELITREPKILADGVITSPPYLNGTNYFRNTRLELWFTEVIKNQKDLRILRDRAITAGINDVTKASGLTVLSEAKKYFDEISKVCYDQRIPKMIAAYFNDMKNVFLGLQKSVKFNGIICVDIGDSIYSGVHIPTNKILMDIGRSIGWTVVEEILLRERFSNDGTRLTQTLMVFKND